MAEKLFFDVKLNGASETIKQLSSIENELKRVAEAKKKEGKVTAELKGQEVTLRAEKKRLNAELNKQTREFNANKNAVRAAAGSYEQLTQKNIALKSQLKKIGEPLGKNKKRFQELSREINANSNKLKGMDKAMGDNFRNVGNYGGAIRNVGLKFVKMAAAVGAAVVALKALFGAFKESIDLFDKQERAEVSLRVALGGTSRALLDQASAMQQLTRFGDETIIQGQAFLAQMGLTEEQILKLTPAILDMAQAQGMDVNSAFQLVAKSAGSSTNALSRYGIEINGVVGSAERVDNTFAALNEKFEGQAEAALAGAGKLTQLSNVFGDLKESIGEVVIDALEPFIDKTISVIKLIDDFIEGEEEVKEITKEQVEATKELNKAEEVKEKKRQKNLNTLRGLKKEVTNLKTALDGAQLGSRNFNNILDQIRTKEEALKKITEALKPPKEFVSDFIKMTKELNELDILTPSSEFMIQNDLLLNEQEKKNTERISRELSEKKQFEAAAFQAAQQGINDIFALQKNARDRTLKADLDALRLRAETGAISEKQFEEQSLALRKQSFQRQKKVDIGQALINGAVAITKTIAQLGGVGAITPMGQALIALMAGQTAAQIGIITAQKFAKGGLVEGGMFEGKSHAEGGVKFASGGKILEAEGGEAIINKRSTAMFKPMLSAMNAAGGGKKFALGGITPDAQLMTGALSEAGIGAEMARQLNKIKVINVVTETTSQQNSITNVESEAIF
jgi:myosin heavy subunit